MLKHQTLTSANRRAHTEHTGTLTPSKELDIILNQSAESNLTAGKSLRLQTINSRNRGVLQILTENIPFYKRFMTFY